MRACFIGEYDGVTFERWRYRVGGKRVDRDRAEGASEDQGEARRSPHSTSASIHSGALYQSEVSASARVYG